MYRLFVYRNKCIQAMPALWESLCAIEPILWQYQRPVLAFVGAGGKTSWIYALAQELRRHGKSVLIATTTHMYRPSHGGVYTGKIEDVLRQLRCEGIAVVGTLAEQNKISYMGNDLFKNACQIADIILVEADGSRRLPAKIMGEHEPVIPEETNVVCCLAGLSALGKQLGKACFRAHQSGYGKNGMITPEIFASLWRKGCLQTLYTRYPKIPVIPILHQADTPVLQEMGRNIYSAIHISGIISAFPERLREKGDAPCILH